MTLKEKLKQTVECCAQNSQNELFFQKLQTYLTEEGFEHIAGLSWRLKLTHETGYFISIWVRAGILMDINYGQQTVLLKSFENMEEADACRVSVYSPEGECHTDYTLKEGLTAALQEIKSRLEQIVEV